MSLTNKDCFVSDPPYIGTGLQSLHTVREGDSLELTCTVSGTPSPTMEWLFNGVSSGNNDTVHLFSSVSENDHGMHQCFAENVYGTDQSSTFVNVQCKSLAIKSSVSLMPEQYLRYR